MPSSCGPECPLCYGTMNHASQIVAEDIEADMLRGQRILGTTSAVAYDVVNARYVWQTTTNSVYVQPSDPVPQYVDPIRWMGDLVAGFRDE